LLSVTLSARTALAPLEAEPGSARVAGLGGIDLGLDQGSAWEHDPAALAGQQRLSFEADETVLPLDLQRQGVQMIWPWKEESAWGLRLSHTSYGDLEQRDETGALLGSFAPQRFGAGVGFGWPISRTLSLGSGLALFQQSLGSTSFGGTLAGLSARWNYHGSQAFSAAYLGSSGDPVGSPGLGLSGGLWRGYYAFAASYNASAGLQMTLGLEQGWGPIALRGAWDLSQNAAAAGSALSFGAGLHWQTWTLDLAWHGLGELGNTERLSLSWSPPLPVPVPTPVMAPPPAAEAVPEPPTSVDDASPQPVSAAAKPALELEFRLPEEPVDQALAAEDAGDSATAQARYEEALKVDPKDTQAWMGLGRLFYGRGQKAYAIQCFEQVLRLNPAETKLKDWLDKVKAQQK
jgi:hypothetical protein